nr:hypothetical protein [Tanacetum cinerariifolium]
MSIGIDAAYQTPWKDLKMMMTKEYCPKNELHKIEVAKYAENKRNWVDNQRGNFGQQQNKRNEVTGPYTVQCGNSKEIASQARDCGTPTPTRNLKIPGTCFECGEKGHLRNDCPKQKNKNGERAHGKGFISFESTAFSPLIDITPNTLDSMYTIKLADGKLIRADIVTQGCTLNLLNHPFNIDLMPIELGSFDVIVEP